MIMKTTKTFALVALAALSLGMGTAMAQEGTTDPGVLYWTLARQADAFRQIEARNQSHVQAGTSDVGAARLGTGHVVPFNFNYTTLANPG
jgi:hypothetical protein